MRKSRMDCRVKPGNDDKRDKATRNHSSGSVVKNSG
jgi:hypothetical protein